MNEAKSRGPARRKPGASLAAIQRAIAGAIMRPLTRSEEMVPESDGVALEIIKPNDRLTSPERLQIYNQQYWWRLLANFGDDFPGVRAVLGTRAFDRLAVAFLEHCGSTSWSLRNLGRNLETFLREHPEYAAPKERLALETARMEWACIDAFDALEKPPIDPQKIARIPPDRIRFKLQPYLTLLELEYPIDDLLRKLKSSDLETGSASNAVSGTRSRRSQRISVRASRTPIHLVVHRLDYLVYYKRLEPEAYRLLLALRNGETLEAACDMAFTDSKELPERNAEKIQSWFALWMSFGWLCS